VSDEPGDRRRILAMGGGGFTMEERTPALDRLVLTLTGKAAPRVCFLPTASGDPREQSTRFYERFGAWPCEPSILSLFNLGRDRIDPIKHLLAQDAIYVGGGSMRNMLAVWREHGVDQAMRAAWESGIVLTGLSGGAPEPVVGLGLLPASLSVHLDGEPERRPAYRAAVAAGELPSGYALADSAALLFHGTRLTACVASRPSARVLRVQADGAGGAEERELPIRVLPGVGGMADGLGESHGVSELRALRAGRRRWD
jgi:dipeptidase E